MATDGLWDFLGKWDVLRHLVEYHNAHLSIHKTKDEERDTSVDESVS